MLFKRWKVSLKILNNTRQQLLKDKGKEETSKTVRTTASLGKLENFTELFKSESKWVLQNSHMALLFEIFKETDKHNDLVIKRTDFVTAVRSNKFVQKFLDEEAVIIDRKTKLTLEDILRDFEKDQHFRNEIELRDPINHKEFFSWDEFVEFVEYYELPKDRESHHAEISTKPILSSKAERGKHFRNML